MELGIYKKNKRPSSTHVILKMFHDNKHDNYSKKISSLVKLVTQGYYMSVNMKHKVLEFFIGFSIGFNVVAIRLVLSLLSLHCHL